MKHLSLLLILFTNILIAQDTLTTKSKIEAVTIFLSGAQVERIAEVSLTKGNNTVILEGLSAGITANSIQVDAGKGTTLMGVQYQINYLKEVKSSGKTRLYKDSLIDLELEKQINDGIFDAYEEEKKLLQENRGIKINERSLYLEDLEDLADFFRRRMSEINLKLMEMRRTDKKLVTKIERIKRYLQNENVIETKPSGEIVLSLVANQNSKIKITAKYFIKQAGWKPNYDVRVNDLTKPLTIDYRAKVWQNSGVDWSNINLVLSTSNPKRNNNKPNFNPWRIYLNSQNINSRESRGYMRQYAPKPYQVEKKKEEEEESMKFKKKSYREDIAKEFMADSKTTADYTEVQESQTSYEFTIDLKYSIQSKNKEHDIYIKKYNINAIYKYYAAPKIRQEAYLLAKVTDWDKLKLLDGQSNIYLNGVFKGTSFINTNNINDTMEFSLGLDEGVIVKREKDKEYSESKVIGSNKKETLGYDINIRNTKKATIHIIIEDQIPITTNKEIEVELIDKPGAKYNEDKGYLKWELDIPASTNKKLNFKYSVKYPKETGITNHY